MASPPCLTSARITDDNARCAIHLIFPSALFDFERDLAKRDRPMDKKRKKRTVYIKCIKGVGMGKVEKREEGATLLIEWRRDAVKERPTISNPCTTNAHKIFLFPKKEERIEKIKAKVEREKTKGVILKWIKVSETVRGERSEKEKEKILFPSTTATQTRKNTTK